VTSATTKSRVQPFTWVEVPKALETLHLRLQSIGVVVDGCRHYILPRIPSYPTHFLVLVGFFLSIIARKTSFYFP